MKLNSHALQSRDMIQNGTSILHRSFKRARSSSIAMGIRERIAFPRYCLKVMRDMRGVHPRQCPLCGFEGLFRAFGYPPRYDAECPACLSLERHRLLAMLLAKTPDLGAARVVHFAPEPQMAKLLKHRSAQYRSADLFRSDCDLRLNIEAMELPDHSVDMFVASHVLEHVDDRRALSELHRCLSPGGVAVIMVPMIEAWDTSYENPAAVVAGEAMRDLHFGQHDHIRYYGSDLRSRMADVGFQVTEYTADGEEAAKYGLVRGETVFLARKPDGQRTSA